MTLLESSYVRYCISVEFKHIVEDLLNIDLAFNTDLYVVNLVYQLHVVYIFTWSIP